MKEDVESHKVSHVLLISIDGMHALDFVNCTKRESAPSTAGEPYCPHFGPNLASTA